MLASRRNAFSLVELLVVIAILAVLAGLTMSGVGYVRVRQQHRASEQTVYKLQEALDQQIKHLTQEVRKERLTHSSVFVGLLNYCANDEDRAEALLLHCRIRHTFPVTFSEARNPLSIPAAGIYWPPHTAFADLPPGINGTPEQESAALLHKALSRLGSGGAIFASDDVMNGTQADIVINNGTVRVFRDFWGTPIHLRRFYSNPELNAPPYINPKPGSRDPFDPLGKLADINWPNRLDAQARLGVNFDATNKVLTIISAGRDRIFDSRDDILGYRLRQLGARGGSTH
jgi:prepilin-type N-terminal cleavage/methylation domain-containing protein